MNNDICFCGNNAFEIRSEKRTMEIEGKFHTISKEYCYCPKCSEEWVTPEQSKASTDQIIAIKRRAQGFLTPRDIKELRERHRLTQKQAAAIFGGGDNAFSKYERGEIYPTVAMDKLMRLFDALPQVRQQLLRSAGIQESTHTFDPVIAKEWRLSLNIFNEKRNLFHTEIENETPRFNLPA